MARDPEKKRIADRESKRRQRARKKAAQFAEQRNLKPMTTTTLPAPGAPAAKAVAEWAAATLRVPHGHPLAGQPMTVPPFVASFLQSALSLGIREALLCVARKNAKSAAIAVLLLAHLVGPLSRPGFRSAVVSLDKTKAAELKRQMQDITGASGLPGLRFLRSPAPGRVEADTGGSTEVLAAADYSGHASGFDLVVVDETGLLKERNRPLLNGLRSAVSARDGRLIHISIRGDSPFVGELIEAAGDPAVHVDLYAAPEAAALDDEAAWRAANPGLGTIKAHAYMARRARWAIANPQDAGDFRSHDLNQKANPAAELVLQPDQWAECEAIVGADDGRYVLGVDPGGPAAMTACAAYWPATGRLAVLAAFGSVPDLATRGADDGVGATYEQLHQAGELLLMGKRQPPLAAVLQEAIGRWGYPAHVVTDHFRRAEVEDALDTIGAPAAGAVETRGRGIHAAEDLRLFRSACADGDVRAGAVQPLMRFGLSGAVVDPTAADGPRLAIGTRGGRVARHRDDVVAAALRAIGSGVRQRRREQAQDGAQPAATASGWQIFPGGGP